MIEVRVPATTANMGTGFDSFGAALGLYNKISVKETEQGLRIKNFGLADYVATGENNLIYRAMLKVFDYVGYERKGLSIHQRSAIPQTRGLGSSSAGIVGGLYAANCLAGKPLSKKELLEMAVKIEGHADNVTPAMLGGFTVSVMQRDRHSYVRHGLKDDLRFAALIPDFPLATKKARSILPRMVTHRDAAYNAGHSALLVASLISGDYSNIRTAIGDRLHQYYRKNLIPSMDELFNICYRHHALGVYLSGAGPTLIAIIGKDNKDFNSEVSRILAQKMQNWHLEILKTDNTGVVEI